MECRSGDKAMRAVLDAAPQSGCEGLLPQNQVHLWLLFENESNVHPSSTSSLREILSADELEAADRFHRSSDRRRYIAAHALIRLALSNYFPVPATDWRFSRDRNQKPIIIAPKEFAAVQFSISHTEGLIACLITRVPEAAVDVERIKPDLELDSVAETVLSACELEWLDKFSRQERIARFFDIWTLKEAYGKARGVGLNLPLKAIRFAIDSENSVSARFGREIQDDAARWNFRLHHFTSGHVLAVAAGRNCEFVERIVTFDEVSLAMDARITPRRRSNLATAIE
jgi:4'-phosphopantetheinyl transferase